MGRKREHNEDAFYLPERERLAIVADGMGGHASGEVASRMAVDTMVSYFAATEEEQELTWPFKVDRDGYNHINRVETAIKLANINIHEEAERNPACRGMGTTVVTVMFLDDKMIIGHVGDSRIYRLREGMLDQLTEDHSLLNDYVKMKQLTPEEIEAFPHKNVIVRALGMKSSVQVDVLQDVPRLGDTYLLCSDGLSGMISDLDIARILARESDLDLACHRLVEAANEAGGTDNITVVAARVEPD